MQIIGRKKEIDFLGSCLNSARPEFLAVYGRRRVGKTYLIREYFHDSFSFYATGIPNVKTREQLKIFRDCLHRYGDPHKNIPSDWLEAFGRLRSVLEAENVNRDPVSGRRVVFLDELPWMDTAKSDFKSALDYFWNSWGCMQQDLLLIICGSATSWIIDNVICDTGGLYNRITRQMYLPPFSLKECEELLQSNGMVMTRRQIIDCYMIFGGVPYYLNLLDRRLSLPQNVDMLLFNENGSLYAEFDRLFASLFKHSGKHIEIIHEIIRRKSGTTRIELSQNPRIGDGQPLTKALKELEQCGFIRKYKNPVKEKQGYFYQIVDPFTLFSLEHTEKRRTDSWSANIGTPRYYAWSGNAFETVCLNHISQIKAALGISGVSTSEYSWKSRESSPGAQIDLLIDRRDGVINLCEMKYSASAFEINADYAKNLINKVDCFRHEVSTDSAVHITIISAEGIAQNRYAGMVQQVITAEDLFR